MAGADQYAPTGRTGLRGVTTGFIYEEFLPQLRGRVGAKNFREMSDNDPVIWAILYLCSMLIRNVDWRVVPANASSKALSGQEFVEQVLFLDMDRPWSSTIQNALSMLRYGYAPMETVFKIRSGPKPEPQYELGSLASRPVPAKPGSIFTDRQVGIHRMFLVGQETVWRWFFDQANTWIGLEQITEDNPSILIPRQKLLLFRTTDELDNPEGRSVLRGSWVPYNRKQTLEIAEGRLAIRSAGIVKMYVPGQYMAPDASDDMKAMRVKFEAIAAAIANERTGSIVLASDMAMSGDGNASTARAFDIEYVAADGRNPGDLSPIIERLDRRIAGTMLADFILMGQQSVGSFALSSDKTAMFSNALGGFLKNIKDELNRTMLPRLWRLNGLPQETMPQLDHGDFEARDIEELGHFLESMTRAGFTMAPDEKLEDVIRTSAKLPPRAETSPPPVPTPGEAQLLHASSIERQLAPPGGDAGAGAPSGGKDDAPKGGRATSGSPTGPKEPKEPKE